MGAVGIEPRVPPERLVQRADSGTNVGGGPDLFLTLGPLAAGERRSDGLCGLRRW